MLSSIASLLLLFTCPLAVNSATAYCDHVLADGHLVMTLSATLTRKVSYFYDVFYTGKTLADSCEIDHIHAIRIKLERITRISDVFIEDLTFSREAAGALDIALRSGATLFQCRYQATRSIDETTGRSFLNYECQDGENAYHLEGLYVNAIEMKSATPLTVNLTNLQRQKPLGWLVAGQWFNENSLHYPERCPPPGLYPGQRVEPAKLFYPSEANVTIRCQDDAFTMEPSAGRRICNYDGIWLPRKAPMCQPTETNNASVQSVQCPPIEPYFGMPEHYKNYELILNGSINKLLLEYPCRAGYRFTASPNEINQCNNGVWKGAGFPQCKLITSKTPPEVMNAVWSYVHDNVFHEIQYKCNSGLHLSAGNGSVTYNFKSDEWLGVPDTCQEASPNLHTTLFVVAVVILIVIIAILSALLIISRRRSNKRNMGLEPKNANEGIPLNRDTNPYSASLLRQYKEQE